MTVHFDLWLLSELGFFSSTKLYFNRPKEEKCHLIINIFLFHSA